MANARGGKIGRRKRRYGRGNDVFALSASGTKPQGMQVRLCSYAVVHVFTVVSTTCTMHFAFSGHGIVEQTEAS